MDGLEATQAIRNSRMKQPVLIAMTANAMQEDKDACLRLGMKITYQNRFILKTC
ncbi:Response regulator receiver domain-containing protein [Pedobacter westerhofensis]|uniref:Response regulator receiver domain-containing protein n=2 Tax=Pedobacter westerhofensis TaxID=425512 RepID=A0A521EU44_9SPHI|nr:Response regulator receiver domain-containing protein [Pedobacter westerhofensis]